MPQGLEVRDSGNNVIVTTNSIVLKQFVISSVNATSNGSVSIPTIANSVIASIVTSNNTAASTNNTPVEYPQLIANTSTNTIDYKFGVGGNYKMDIRVLAF